MSDRPHLGMPVAISRCLIAAAAMALCAATSGSSSNSTLIFGTRVALGPLAGVPANLAYTAINGLVQDLNGDGLPDIVIGINGVPPAVYLNNGTANPFQGVQGTLVAQPPDPTMSSLGWGAAVASDVNEDGHPDLVIAGFNGPNLIYLNNGTSDPFSGGASVAVGVMDVAYFQALGDVNGDGYPDMVVANTNHVASNLYLTNGAPLTSGTYSTVQLGTDVGYGQAVRIADVNGDGKPDVIMTFTIAGTAGTDPSGIAIYLNNGTSDPFGAVAPIRLLAGESVYAIAVADLNNNGTADLVVSAFDAAYTTHQYIYLNSGSASQPFVNSQELIADPDIDAGGVCSSISTGDVDGDGRVDLSFACKSPNATPTPASPALGSVYLNNGTSNPFANVAPVGIPATIPGAFSQSTVPATLAKNGGRSMLIVDENTVTAGQSGLASYQALVMDPNPTANDDSAILAIDNSKLLDVLANDTAAPGQVLATGSLVIVTAPAHGTAVVNASNGMITLQPTTGFSGGDSFQYTVKDGLGASSNVATVSVTVQSAPNAVNDVVTVPAGQGNSIDVLANDRSVGGTLNASSIDVIVAPAHGTAAALGGKVTYTPTTGYSGIDTFQYTVQDNLGTASNVATVSIEVTSPQSGGGGNAGSSGGGGALGAVDFIVLAGLLLARRRRPDPRAPWWIA